MRATLLLRIASGVALLFAAGHASGAFDSWSPKGETEVLTAMRSFRFDTMGVERSYWHFYFGFGLFIAVLLTLEAVLLWQIASLAKGEPARARPLVISVLIASIACTAIAWQYIFFVPVLFLAAITVLLALALVGLRERAQAGSKPRS